MHKNREILRQKWVMGRSHREVAKSVGVGASTVGKVFKQALKARLTWETVQGLDEEELSIAMYGADVDGRDGERPLPDFQKLHEERHRKGVTLMLLHDEYLQKQEKGYGYSQFCAHYRKWLSTRNLTMKIQHYAGDKCFVDYSGAKPHLTDPNTGEVTEVELFIGVLGASNYTFAEATRTQDERIDERIRYREIPDDRVYGADTAEEALALLDRNVERYSGKHREIR